MNKPSGKLAFAYATIANLEKKIARLEAEQPAPVAVVLPQRKHVPDFALHPLLNKEYTGFNACLDELKSLNTGAVPGVLMTGRRPIPAGIESLAQQIYQSWESQPGFVPWVDGGNSLKQDEARQIASRTFELALANQVGD